MVRYGMLHGALTSVGLGYPREFREEAEIGVGWVMWGACDPSGDGLVCREPVNPQGRGRVREGTVSHVNLKAESQPLK